MSKRVRKNWAFIHFILETRSKTQRRAITKTANPEQCKALAEIVANAIAGTLPLSPREKKLLLPYKNVLREIAHKSTTDKNRKKLILQNISIIVKLLVSVRPAIDLMKP